MLGLGWYLAVVHGRLQLSEQAGTLVLQVRHAGDGNQIRVPCEKLSFSHMFTLPYFLGLNNTVAQSNYLC